MVSNVPASAEIYVESDACEVSINGNDVKGEPSCPFQLAVVLKDGSVTRLSGNLGPAEDPEDIPLPVQKKPEPSPTETAVSTKTPKAKVPTTKLLETESKSTRPELAWGASVGINRDVTDFGFVGFGVGAGVFYRDRFYVGGSWERALGRAETDLLDTQESIEEELDLFLFQLRYLHSFTPHLAAYAGAAVGPGRLVSEAESDDRNQLNSATQAFIVYRPSAGVRWRSGALQLTLGWQVSFAEGAWYQADAFGSAESDDPPERSGVLSQGVELSVGFAL